MKQNKIKKSREYLLQNFKPKEFVKLSKSKAEVTHHQTIQISVGVSHYKYLSVVSVRPDQEPEPFTMEKRDSYIVQWNDDSFPLTKYFNAENKINSDFKIIHVKGETLVSIQVVIQQAIMAWDDLEYKSSVSPFSFVYGYAISEGIDLYEVGIFEK